MLADIYWKKNQISGGVDDPHYLTENEGLHATLLITSEKNQINLIVPEFQYSKKTVELLEKIKRLINEN